MILCRALIIIIMLILLIYTLHLFLKESTAIHYILQENSILQPVGMILATNNTKSHSGIKELHNFSKKNNNIIPYSSTTKQTHLLGKNQSIINLNNG